MNTDALPPRFLRKVITVCGRLHVVFSTSTQLHLLADATIWYINGTFKVLSHPFTQLVSEHAFLKKDRTLKQVPLVFVMMSGKRKEDYVAVFEAVSQMLPLHPKVERFVVDYEEGENAILLYYYAMLSLWCQDYV